MADHTAERMSRSEALSSFWSGFKAISPVILGFMPFALVSGAASIAVGMDPLQSWLFCWVVFAGAAQLAALQMVAEHTPVLVIILTGLAINLRFIMYSASLAPHFQGRPLPWRLALSYLITDQAYAVSIARFEKIDSVPRRIWFYLGASFPLWILWQIGTLAGAFLGAAVPDSWSLDFAVPLTFMSIWLPALKGKPHLAAAGVAGAVALMSTDLPYNLGIMTAAFSGIATGYLLERRLAR